MALDTSSDGYEKVYESSGPENSGKYYEGYVEKKELFKWIRFWCVLKQQNIYFFKDVNTQIKENYFGFLSLEHPTNVEIIKSKEGKYQWSIRTRKGKITLRTQVATLRDGWIASMEKSLKHDPPSTQSYILEGSGPVSPKHHQASPNPSCPTRTPSQVSSHHNPSKVSSHHNPSKVSSHHNPSQVSSHHNPSKVSSHHNPSQVSSHHNPSQVSSHHNPSQVSSHHNPSQVSSHHNPSQVSSHHNPSQVSSHHNPSQVSSHHNPSQVSSHHNPSKVSSHHNPSQVSSHHNPSRRESTINYIITEEQVATWKEFSSEIESMVELTDEELKIQDRLLKGDGWYQASYRREDVEKVLKNEGNGVFIVRDYIDFKTSKNLGYVISLKDETRQMRHHRIQKVHDSFVIKGYEGRSFDSLHNLLRFFTLSQRKKITLVPFDPKKQSQPQQIPQSPSGYEEMNAGQPMNGNVEQKPRSVSLRVRQLPPVPPDPSQSMARSRTIQNHQHHSPPYLQDTQQPPKSSYVEMKTPFKDRSLPPVPELQQNMYPQSVPSAADSGYLNMPAPTLPVNHFSYENIESTPFKDRSLPPVPELQQNSKWTSSYEAVMYPQSVPSAADSGYLNMPAPTLPVNHFSYGNIESSSYENTPGAAEVEDEPVPVLPPRKPQSFREPPKRYVNLPPGGNIPGRYPLRKANTFS